METAQRIVEKAHALFFRHGVKRITMDDIASELGISKKTIYQYFPDKDELVYKVSEWQMTCEKALIDQAQHQSRSVLDHIYFTAEMMHASFANMNPALLTDIRKYHPRAWELFNSFKRKTLLETIEKEIRTGIEEGIFRKDTQVEILARMRLEQIELGFEPDVFPPTTFKLIDVQMAFFDHFLRGILTPEGLSKYQDFTLKKQ